MCTSDGDHDSSKLFDLLNRAGCCQQSRAAFEEREGKIRREYHSSRTRSSVIALQGSTRLWVRKISSHELRADLSPHCDNLAVHRSLNHFFVEESVWRPLAVGRWQKAIVDIFFDSSVRLVQAADHCLHSHRDTSEFLQRWARSELKSARERAHQVAQTSSQHAYVKGVISAVFLVLTGVGVATALLQQWNSVLTMVTAGVLGATMSVAARLSRHGFAGIDSTRGRYLTCVVGFSWPLIGTCFAVAAALLLQLGMTPFKLPEGTASIQLAYLGVFTFVAGWSERGAKDSVLNSVPVHAASAVPNIGPDDDYFNEGGGGGARNPDPTDSTDPVHQNGHRREVETAN